MTQAGVSRARAVKALKASSGDIVSGETLHTTAAGPVLLTCFQGPWACLLDQLCVLVGPWVLAGSSVCAGCAGDFAWPEDVLLCLRYSFRHCRGIHKFGQRHTQHHLC